MKNNLISIEMRKHAIWPVSLIQTFFLLFTVVLLTGCAQSLAEITPTSQPSPQPTITLTTDPTVTVIEATKVQLANQLKVEVDRVKLVRIEPIQWPDGCLGVPQTGIMCAMHVVDGYRISLSVNEQTYEVHSNQDGEQIVIVPGVIPTPAGLSYTVQNGDSCQTYLFSENQDAAMGDCRSILKRAPFIEYFQRSALDHYIQTFKPFLYDTQDGFVNFSGKGQARATAVEERSIAAWVQVTSSEIQAGRSSAADGLAFSWHREGGVAGFCNDLSVYTSGAMFATDCKNGKAHDLGQAWLDSTQLTQLYQWLDRLTRFEYAPQSQATTDAMTIRLVFSGQGSVKPSENDQKAVELFAEQLYAGMDQAGGSTNADAPAQVVTDFLNSLKNDPSGKSSLGDLSSSVQADIRGGDLVPTLLGIQNTYSSFGISGTWQTAGTDIVFVDAILNYVSPIRRTFALVKEHNTYRINTFIVYAFPSMTPVKDFQPADQVIIRYVQALSGKDADTAWELLSPEAQNITTKADLLKKSQGLQKITPISLVLNEPGQDQLSYRVKLWVDLAQDPAEGWNTGPNTRSYKMVQTGQGWKISQIVSDN